MATGQIPDAISAFRRAAEINPQDGAVQQNLANALFDARNVDAAAEQRGAPSRSRTILWRTTCLVRSSRSRDS